MSKATECSVQIGKANAYIDSLGYLLEHVRKLEDLGANTNRRLLDDASEYLQKAWVKLECFRTNLFVCREDTLREEE